MGSPHSNWFILPEVPSNFRLSLISSLRRESDSVLCGRKVWAKKLSSKIQCFYWSSGLSSTNICDHLLCEVKTLEQHGLTIHVLFQSEFTSNSSQQLTTLTLCPIWCCLGLYPACPTGMSLLDLWPFYTIWWQAGLLSSDVNRITSWIYKCTFWHCVDECTVSLLLSLGQQHTEAAEVLTSPQMKIIYKYINSNQAVSAQGKASGTLRSYPYTARWEFTFHFPIFNDP